MDQSIRSRSAAPLHQQGEDYFSLPASLNSRDSTTDAYGIPPVCSGASAKLQAWQGSGGYVAWSPSAASTQGSPAWTQDVSIRAPASQSEEPAARLHLTGTALGLDLGSATLTSPSRPDLLGPAHPSGELGALAMRRAATMPSHCPSTGMDPGLGWTASPRSAGDVSPRMHGEIQSPVSIVIEAANARGEVVRTAPIPTALPRNLGFIRRPALRTRRCPDVMVQEFKEVLPRRIAQTTTFLRSLRGRINHWVSCLPDQIAATQDALASIGVWFRETLAELREFRSCRGCLFPELSGPTESSGAPVASPYQGFIPHRCVPGNDCVHHF